MSAANLRTTYAYDSAGRLEYETITKETGGGTTDLYKTQYAYAYIAAGSGGGRSLTRTEQTNSGGWVNDNKVLYECNALEWMRKEQRHDWVSSAWSAVYDVNQEYDKRGNRTRYDKNVQGLTADYGRQYDLAYSFNGSSILTGISDANDANYSCTVTCDANNNIATLDELILQPGLPPQINHLYTYFDVDALNRVTAHRTKHYVAGGTNAWMWAKRAHEYDGLGRLVRSTYKTWQDGSSEPAGTSLEHTYDQQGRHLQNYDGTSAYGQVWHWAGADPMPETAHPLKSPNADTASTTAYNHADNATPQRRTFVDPTPTEGDERHLWGQGRPQAKDSSGAGSNWATGTISQPTGLGVPAVESRLMYEGTVTTALGRATDAREKGRIGIFGTGLSYVGSSSRVVSESIGRDINPLGRANGYSYLLGWMNFGKLTPARPLLPVPGGSGNSANNWLLADVCCCMKECHPNCVGDGGAYGNTTCEPVYATIIDGEPRFCRDLNLSLRQKCCCCSCSCLWSASLLPGGIPETCSFINATYNCSNYTSKCCPSTVEQYHMSHSSCATCGNSRHSNQFTLGWFLKYTIPGTTDLSKCKTFVTLALTRLRIQLSKGRYEECNCILSDWMWDALNTCLSWPIYLCKDVETPYKQGCHLCQLNGSRACAACDRSQGRIFYCCYVACNDQSFGGSGVKVTTPNCLGALILAHEFLHCCGNWYGHGPVNGVYPHQVLQEWINCWCSGQ